MKLFKSNLLLLVAIPSAVQSYSIQPPHNRSQLSRRSVLAGIAAATIPTLANALDFDAFVNQELDQDNKKSTTKLSEDEALCQFGQPSSETGEACVRAGMSTKRPTGVDAFGKVDRGNFTRCKAVWVDPGPNQKLVKEWQCS